MGRTAYLDAGAGFARPGYQRPERDTNAGKSSCRAQRGGFPGGAGAEGLEPPAYGFGDRRSTN